MSSYNSFMKHAADIEPKQLRFKIERMIGQVGSEKALAELLGVSDRMVRYWTNQEKPISTTALKLLECLEEKYLKRGK